jgi:carbon storage regulator CsrA
MAQRRDQGSITNQGSVLMLVLTRKHQEKIRIGEHIVITVLKTKGKTVRLGIEAPSEVPVIRGELSFEGQAVEWQDDASDGDVEPTATDTLHVDRVRKHWPPKADRVEAGRVATHPIHGATQISLQRVPREQLGEKPLRALLNRRSVVG